jgi:hypothetical protein
MMHAIDNVGVEFPRRVEEIIKAAAAEGQPLPPKEARSRRKQARRAWRKLRQVWAGICSEQHPKLAQPPAVSDGIEQLEQEWMQRITQALRPHLDPDSYA